MNERIKRTLRTNAIPQWRLAQDAGISEQTLIRWLREPLDGERKAAVETALKELLQKGIGHGE